MILDSLVTLTGILNVMPDAIIVVDGEGRIVFANAAVQDQFGYTPDELQQESLDCLIPTAHRSQHRSDLVAYRQHGKPMIMTHRPVIHGLDKAGEEIPLSISIANFELEGELYSIAVVRDGGDVQSEITEVTHQAETDPLTGIANRLRVSQKLESAIAAARPFGLLFLDLEKFKPFNDEYGHDVGDRVLQIVASRLQAMVRTNDLAARLGGDEFLLIIDQLQDSAILGQRAVAVAEGVTRDFHIGDLTGSIGVNIGGALFPRDGGGEDELLRAADRNMYRAKLSGQSYCID